MAGRSGSILRAAARAYSTRARAGGGHDDDIFDVAIVGAGMVGAAVAALLRANALTAGLRVAILDRAPPPPSPLGARGGGASPSSSSSPPPVPDMRVSTITPASIRVLEAARAWANVAPPASAEFCDMQVWDAAGPGHVRWRAADVGAPRMGIVAENRLLQAALLRAAVDADSGPGRPAELIAPVSIEALRLPHDAAAAAAAAAASGRSSSSSGSNSDNGPSSSSSSAAEAAAAAAAAAGNALAELGLQGGRSLRARLVVGADGAGSRVRSLAGMRTFGWSYRQRGLVATVMTDPSPNPCAWQRFLPDGPLALLPVRDGYSNIVWTNTPEGAARLEAMTSDEFAAAANEALHGGGGHQQQQQHPGLTAALSGVLNAGASLLQSAGALGGGSGSSSGFGDSGGGGGGANAFVPPPRVLGYCGAPPRSFPLALAHSGRYAAARLALVGDAAHAVHPLAGQGVNLGLGDAAALASALAAAREAGRDIGELGLLRDEYEAPRQAANLSMMAALDALQRLFCAGSGGGEGGGGVIGAARSAGLAAVNAAGPVRNAFMRYAMGDAP